MFDHAWHWITRSTRRPPPYWFCAKCGAQIETDVQPPVRGCESR
jgi:ABC-type ATPase with predicted acetyltransferase domain